MNNNMNFNYYNNTCSDDETIDVNMFSIGLEEDTKENNRQNNEQEINKLVVKLTEYIGYVNKDDITYTPQTVCDYSQTLQHLEISSIGIKNIFKLPDNVKHLDINDNELGNILPDIIPESLEIINVNDNLIENLDFVKENIKHVKAKNNYISQVRGNNLVNLVKLDIEGNEIKNIINIPVLNNLTYLNISNNMVENIDILENNTPNLKYLIAVDCMIKTINSLPQSLIKLSCGDNLIKCINCSFPNSLKYINLFNNCLEELPNLHSNVYNIDLRNNCLKKMINYCDTIERLDIRENKDLRLDDNEKERIKILNSNGIKVFIDSTESLLWHEKLKQFYEMNFNDTPGVNNGLGDKIVHQNTYNL